jgi:hypothetical protein
MYGNKSYVHEITWTLRRALGQSPMQKLIQKLKKRGVLLNQLDALEIFGADGSRHTVDYCRLVRSLEIWEKDDRYLPGLHKNFPNARIKITDAFKEIESTCNTYSLLVSDEPGQLFGANQEYCEHFDLLTNHLFRILQPSAVIILNVVPEPLKQIPSGKPYPAYPRYLEKRGVFYETDHPDHVSIEEMIPAYRRTANRSGFNLEWHTSVRRTIRSGVSYLALKVNRI